MLPPADSDLLDGTAVPADECDVLIRAVSMGLSHRAIPGTSAMCAAAAANIEGTVVQRCSTSSGSELRIATPSGVVATAADVSAEDGGLKVTAASLFRTARPLMRGQVALPQ